jgi:Domain of unknown function (DUF1835)
MTLPTLHIVFDPAAAHRLRAMLDRAACSDPIIAFRDDLSFGPIDPPDAACRKSWIEAELGDLDWHAIMPDLARFWEGRWLPASAASHGCHAALHGTMQGFSNFSCGLARRLAT